MGAALLRALQSEEAENLYNEALAIDPKNAGAMLGMAKLFADEYDPKARNRAESPRFRSEALPGA